MAAKERRAPRTKAPAQPNVTAEKVPDGGALADARATGAGTLLAGLGEISAELGFGAAVCGDRQGRLAHERGEELRTADGLCEKAGHPRFGAGRTILGHSVCGQG